MRKKRTHNYLKQILFALWFININFTYAKEFVIGVEANSYYPLYEFSKNDTSKPSYSRDILSAFFEKHNYSYRFVALPIKRFNKWYVEKEIDFKFPDNLMWHHYQQNEFDLTFSQPVIKLIAGSYVLRSNAKYKRENIKKLATIFGFTPALWLDEVNSKKVDLVEENTPLSIVKHILHGNVDATNIDANVIRHNLKLLGKPQAIVLNTNIKHQEYSYHLSTIYHPKIIKQFNDFLQNNPAILLKLKQKYGIIEEIQ